MRRTAATLLTVFLLAQPNANAATSWGTDFSDLWWVPTENGWGANIAHQGDIIFLTMFVYGGDGTPRWYVASGMQYQGGSGPLTFTGALYETRGPFFAAFPFNPSNVLVRQVGTATLSFTFIERGVLRYSVDGAFIEKTIQRQTFRNNTLTGRYSGGLVVTQSNCIAPAYFASDFNISQSGTTVSIGTSNCNYAASYSQAGRMGYLSGTFSCFNGARGNFQAYEIEVGQVGLGARYDAQYSNPAGCTETGRLGGIRR